MITDRSVEFTFIPLTVSENSGDLLASWRVKVRLDPVRLAPPVEPGLQRL